MFMRPLNHSEVREIIQRDEELQKHANKLLCPSCQSDQMQLKFKTKPARWKCRSCGNWLTSEPTLND